MGAGDELRSRLGSAGEGPAVAGIKIAVRRGPSAQVAQKKPAAPNVVKNTPDNPLRQSPEKNPKPVEARSPQQSTDPQKLPTLIDDAELDAAVEDVKRQNAAETTDDTARPDDDVPPEGWRKIPYLIKRFCIAWWRNKKARYSTFAALGALLLILLAIPVTRYTMLGLVGMKGTVEIRVLDQTSNQPLKNVQVTIGSQSVKTDKDGTALLKKIKLGKHAMKIAKLAFAPVERSVLVGTGTTKPDTVSLRAVGAQYKVRVLDYVSNRPLATAEATSGESNANADKEGMVILTIGQTDADSIKIVIGAKDYRQETITVPMDTSMPETVRLVPSSKAVYVSNQSGKYDLVASYIDGKDKKTLLAGTGLERKNTLGLSVDATGKMAAFISTRDNQKTPDGFLLSALNLITLDTGAVLTIDHAEQIRLIGWTKDTVVYQEVVSGTSAANPNRSRIIAYNYVKSERNQLASANYFEGAELVGDTLYYATSSTNPEEPSALFSIKADTTGRRTIMREKFWSMLRTNYETIALQTPKQWLAYTIGSSSAPKQGAQPAELYSRTFATNTDQSKSLWIDVRDGKGVLLARDLKTKKDTVAKTDEGLAQPIRWLTDEIVLYHIASSSHTTMYALNLTNGATKKVTDVTLTY